MNRLTVLYDKNCGLCRRCRWWLAAEPAYVELDFLAAQSPDVVRRFPGLEPEGKPEELIVVSDDGGVYRGPEAFIMCLWALENYREWSEVLARPALMPLARHAFGLLSENRRSITKWLGWGGTDELAEALRKEPPVEESCDFHPAHPEGA